MLKICHLSFKRIFFQVLGDYIKDVSKIEKIHNDVVKMYSSRGRYYHNMDHVHKMVHMWTEHIDQMKNPNEVFLAIVYHDIIYKARRNDNEEQSAQYFIKLAMSKYVNIDIEKIALIVHLIRYTKHDCSNSTFNQDTKLLLDFDLMTLATSESDYKLYTEQVRQEYKMYPNFIYKKGRLDFLQKFLKRETIYLSEEFKIFENKARKNIESEINYLNLSKKRSYEKK